MSQLIALLGQGGGSTIGTPGMPGAPSSIQNTLYNFIKGSGTPGAGGNFYNNPQAATNPYAVPTSSTPSGGSYYGGTRSQ